MFYDITVFPFWLNITRSFYISFVSTDYILHSGEVSVLSKRWLKLFLCVFSIIGAASEPALKYFSIIGGMGSFCSSFAFFPLYKNRSTEICYSRVEGPTTGRIVQKKNIGGKGELS